MAVRIVLKRSSIPFKRPNADILDPGELALNTNALTPGLFFEADNNTVIKVGPTAVGTSPPTNFPSLGESFYNDVTGSLSVGTIDPDTLQQVWKEISAPFLGGTNGYVVFVAGEFPNATDSILNDGQSSPFKTLNRAVIEIAKQSIRQNESDLDANNRFTIVVAPGYTPVYNGPGLPLVNPNNPDVIPEFNIKFEGTDPDSPDVLNLQTFNPTTGGLPLPRGTSIIGMDLRKVELRPSYVPSYENPTTLAGENQPITGVVKWTGNSLVETLSFRDKVVQINVSGFKAGDAGEGVFISSRPHTLSLNDRVYFQFTSGADQRPIEGGTEAGIPPGFYYAYPLSTTTFLLSSTFIRQTEANYVLRRQLPAYPQNAAILATCTWPGRSHNRLRALYPASQTELNEFYIKVQKAYFETFQGKTNQAEVVNPGETDIVARVPSSIIESTLSNSTNNASPYVTNCTVRSNYGMCGLEQDGDIVSGFRSALADAFSVVSIQNDPAAYDVYTTIQNDEGVNVTKWYTLEYATWKSIPPAFRPESSSEVSVDAQLEFLNATDVTNIRFHYVTQAIDKKSIGIPDLYRDFRHFGVRATNRGYIQTDSSWTIGTAVGFWALNGGDVTATNCSSNFGLTAIRSEGFYRIGQDSLTVPPEPANAGFLFQGIRTPRALTKDEAVSSTTFSLGAQVTEVKIDPGNPAVQLISLTAGFQPINLLPYSLAPDTAIYVQATSELSYRAIFVKDGLPTVVFNQDGTCVLRVRSRDSGFPLGTKATIPTMGSWPSPYISRWEDPRPLRDRVYSLILGNSTTSHLAPSYGKVLRLNQTTAGANLYRPGVQLDPGPSGGWGRVFQVAYSETAEVGNNPTPNEVTLNRIAGSQYYTSLQLCDAARPWNEELNNPHGGYATFAERNWYAAANNMWTGVYYNDAVEPTGEVKLNPQQAYSPWAITASTEVQVLVRETYQGNYAPDPYRELYQEDTYFRGDTGCQSNYFLENAVNIDNGTPSKGLLRYNVPVPTVVTDTTEILLPEQTTVTVNDVSKIPNPQKDFVVMSITNTKYPGRLEYVQIVGLDTVTKTLTLIRGIYGTTTLENWDSGSSMMLQAENTVPDEDEYDFDWAPSKAAMIRFLQVMGYTDKDIDAILTPRPYYNRNVPVTDISVEPKSGLGYATSTGAWPLEFTANSSISALSHTFHSAGRLSYSKGLPQYLRNQIPLKQYFDYLATSAWAGSMVVTGADENGNIVSEGDNKQLSTGRPLGSTGSFLSADGGVAGGMSGGGGGGGGGGSGTVTSIFTGQGLTGGPIYTSGTISLLPASSVTIGGIKVGSTLTIGADGTLNVGAVRATQVATDPIPGITGDNVQLALEELQAEFQAIAGVNILAGTYDAATGKVAYATPAGAAKGFVVGQNVPPASPNIDNYYVIITIGGDQGPNGPQRSQAGDWYICQADEGTTPTWFLIDYENITAQASNVSVVEIPGIENATNVQSALELIELQVQDRIEFVVPTTEGLQVEVVTPDTVLDDDLPSASNDGTTLLLGLDYANTSQKGVVQLTNDLTGTSEELAITQRAGSILEAEIQALVGVNVLAGTYDALTGVMVSVTVAGSIHGFVAGEQAPPASIVPDNYFVIVTIGGKEGPPGAPIPTRGVQPGDWFIVQADGGPSEWFTIDFDNRSTAAVLVSLASIPGLSASNVQTGLEEVAAQLWEAIDKITSVNDAITITASEPVPGNGIDVTIELNSATETDIGGVFVPQTTDGGINLSPSGGLSLKIASTTSLGGVKVGRNLTIDPDGTLNADDAATIYSDEVLMLTPIPGIESAANVQEALEGIELQVQDRIEFLSPSTEGILIELDDPKPGNDGTRGTIGVTYADLTRKGIVQLSNDVTGTSESLVCTQAAIAGLNAKVDALVGSNILAGTYDSLAGKVVQTTVVGRLAGFVNGQQAPAASSVPDNYYLIVVVGGELGPPGAVIPTVYVQPGDWFIVQKEPGQQAEWFCIDYENRATTASLVAVTPIPGISASNVQTALEAEATALWQRVDSIISTNRGITVDVTAPVVGTGLNATLTLQPATAFDVGGVYVPTPNSNGILLDEVGGISLKVAGNQQLGGIKVGRNLAIDPDGTLNAEGSGSPYARDVLIDPPIPGITQATNVQGGLESIELQVRDRVEFALATTNGLLIDITNPAVDSYDGTTLKLGLQYATTTEQGIVQLTNDPLGTSQTIAPTQFALSVLNAKVDALAGSNILAGTYNAKSGQMVTTTAAGYAQGFRAGRIPPAARADLDNYYVIVIVSGNVGPPGSTVPVTGAQSGDWFIVQDDIGLPEWLLIDFENRDVAASSVYLAPIPGLAAGDVQAGMNELAGKLWPTISAVQSGNNGLSLSLSPVTPGLTRTLTATLNPATASDLGGVYVAPFSGLQVSMAGGLSIAPATALSLGGIKVGSGLKITEDGTLSTDGGGSASQIVVNRIPGIDGARTVQEALEAIELQNQDRVEFCVVNGLGITAAVSAPSLTSNQGTTITLTPTVATVGVQGFTTLTNDFTGTSEVLAITQKAAAQLNSKIEAITGGNVLAGTYDCARGVVESVTPAGSPYFRVNQQAPAASGLPDNYYLLVTKSGSLGPPGATIPTTGVQSGDWFIVENQPPFAAVWITIDFEQNNVAAIDVALAPVAGLSATNVQVAVQELEIKAEKSITNITTPGSDGLSVTLSPQSPNGITAALRLGPATQTDLGGVFVQSAQSGLLLGANGSLSLGIASALTLGGIRVGSGLTIDSNGILSATASGQASAITVVPIPGIGTAQNVQTALEAIELQVQDRVEFCNIAGAGGLTASISPPRTTSNDGTTLTLTTTRASISQAGVTVLTNDFTGNAEDLALTQKGAAQLNAKVDALSGANVLAGTYNAAQGRVATVTPAGSAYLAPGAQAPPATAVPDNYYLLVTTSGSLGPPGAVLPPSGVQSGDWFIVEKLDGADVWVTIDFENSAVAAVNVRLSNVPGLSATNVQVGIEQLELKAENSYTNITATSADGIRVTSTAASPNGKTANISLAPATSTDLGGVFVQPGGGIQLGTNGNLTLEPATRTTLGGVKVGAGLLVTADGTLSTGGGGVDIKLVTLDNSFDGSRTTFGLRSGGQVFAPSAAYYILVALGGVIQTANDAYTVSGTNIIFSSAPAAGTSFYCIGFG